MMNAIDMDYLVAGLEAAGIRAYVEQTGGGCATLYVGDPIPDGREPGWDAYPVVAGPGWFDGPGWTHPKGDRGDFYIGPDDDEGEYLTAPEDWSDDEILSKIITMYRGAVGQG